MDLVQRRPLAPDRQRLLSKGGLGSEARALVARITGGDPATDPRWREALTHGSTGEAENYERLEFLGDRVLGLVIAEWLHERSHGSEGQLSQRLNALVSREVNATIARRIGLGPHIRLGKQARDDGGADSDNILGDVIEALIGASFLVRGFEPTRAMVRALWAEEVNGEAGRSKHPKSALQEWAAGNKRAMPEYRVTDRSGPDHAASFTVSVSIRNVGEAEATGSSKQEAETHAAEAFMRRFG
jgi:ribonuclease III